MDFIYLLMSCAVTAFIIVAIASAFWFILVLLTDLTGAITLILFGITLLVGGLK